MMKSLGMNSLLLSPLLSPHRFTQQLHVVLLSPYEPGHQPFGLTSLTARLEQAGALITCIDLAIQSFEDAAVASTDMVAIYASMHTATRHKPIPYLS